MPNAPYTTVRFLPEPDIIKSAEDFLAEHNPFNFLPVPIEEILERDLDLRIMPVPDLKQEWGCDSYISADFTVITIDDKCYMKMPERARFSLAHEAAHFVLHKDVFAAQTFSNIDEYLRFINSMSLPDIKRYESQADKFAAHLLMPGYQFSQITEEMVEKAGGANAIYLSDIQSIGKALSDTFGVSGQAILIQLEKKYGKEVLFNWLEKS